MDEELHRIHAEFEESYWWWVAKNTIIVSLIERFARPASGAPGAVHGRACDIGCGAGGLLARLAQRYDAVGVDMSPLALEYCRKRGLTAVEGSLPDRVPLESETFDVVVMSEVVEHVERDGEAVQAAVRLLKPGGLLVCTVPAHQWMWSSHDDHNHHCRRYSTRAFRQLFAGQPLATEVVSQYNAAMFLPMAALRIGRRVLGAEPARASLRTLPAPLNEGLRWVFAAERHVLPWVRLPFGVSLIGVHRKLATQNLA